MGLKFTEKIKIEADYCDEFGELKLNHLLHLMIRVTAHQEEKLEGVRAFLDANHYSWVIVYNDVEFFSPIKQGMTITVTTEGWAYNRFFTIRYFDVCDEQGTPLLHIDMQFTIIDLIHRKLIRLPQFLIDAYQVVYRKQLPAIKKLKKRLVDSTTTNKVVIPSDIDGNGHVNNTIYFRWLLEDLGVQWQQMYGLKHLYVKYEHELYLDQRVSVETTRLSSTDDNIVTTQHIIHHDGITNALIELVWYKRK